MTVQTFGLTHLALGVADPKRAFEFYRAVFGMVAVYEQDDLIQAQTPGAWDVLVFQRVEGPTGSSGTLAHFGFRLTHLTAMEDIVAAVTAAGGRVGETGEFCPGEPYAFVQDPDGYTIEIWHERPTPVDPPRAFTPIGRVRSAFTNTAQIPKGLGAEHRAEGVLEIETSLEAGLADIEGFSHLYVLWVFDRVDGVELIARPPSDDRPHGVFATRSPRRPNPIGLTVVELLGRDGSSLRVAGIDMLDGTPILDIKPYLSNIPDNALRRGWLAEAEARRPKR